MKVMKFGGTSVGSVNSILSVKRIVESASEPVIVDGPNKMGIITPEGNVMVLDDDNGKLTVYINGDVGLAAKGNISIQAQLNFHRPTYWTSGRVAAA